MRTLLAAARDLARATPLIAIAFTSTASATERWAWQQPAWYLPWPLICLGGLVALRVDGTRANGAARPRLRAAVWVGWALQWHACVIYHAGRLGLAGEQGAVSLVALGGFASGALALALLARLLAEAMPQGAGGRTLWALVGALVATLVCSPVAMHTLLMSAMRSMG